MKNIDFFIVDDSDVNNYYTQDLLEEFDFTKSVTVFTRAKEALNELINRDENKTKQPDIILLDVRMPEMDGFEFLEEIDQQLESLLETTKIFLLTSSKHRHDLESFQKQEVALEFLNKPLEGPQLLEKLNIHFSEK
jgi:CheY-like chemotaxis protein